MGTGSVWGFAQKLSRKMKMMMVKKKSVGLRAAG
jgi:hypothetical protein